MPLSSAFEGLEPVRPTDYVPGAPRGASTVCWGPDLWQVLHAISFYARSPRLIARLVELLGILLPCKFCRESWPAFVAALVKESGKSVERHVTDGTFPRFLFDAHNCVNDKLTRQRVADAAGKVAPLLAAKLGLPASTNKDVEAAFCAAIGEARIYGELDKRPSFECVQKRYYIAGSVPFSCTCLWRALLIFTINFSPDKGAAFVGLLRVLGELLETDLPATATIRGAAATLKRAADALEVQEAKRPLDQDDVFGVLALAQAWCEGKADELATPEARRSFLADMHRRVEVAAAGVCLNGVCK